MIRPPFRTRPATRAQALVEFVLIFPTFFALLMAFLDFGYLLFVQNTVHHALREGVRQAECRASDAAVRSTIRAQAIGVRIEDRHIEIESGRPEAGTPPDSDTVTVRLDHNFFMPWWHEGPLPIRFSITGHRFDIPGGSP